MLLLEAPIVMKNRLLGSAYEINKDKTLTQNIKPQILNILLACTRCVRCRDRH